MFTKVVNPRLAKRPLIFNGRLANRGLTSLVKEATGLPDWQHGNRIRTSDVTMQLCTKLLIHSQTSTVQSSKMGNG